MGMIRFATLQDVPAILAIYGPYITDTTISFEYEVPSLESFTQRFLEITAQYPWLVYEEEGKILGYAYGGPTFARAAYQWSAESSVYLCPEVKGRGIGRKLYAVLEELLKLQGYRKLYALITSENETSLAFHKAVGFSFTAYFPDIGIKFGRSLGVTWMEKCLKMGELPSKFPMSIKFVVSIDRKFQ